jgi:hypothetical protein
MADYTFQDMTIIAPVSFESEQKILSTKTWGSSEERVVMDGQRWKVTFNVEPHEGASLLPHLVSSFGDTFDFEMPQAEDPTLDHEFRHVYSTSAALAGTNAIQISDDDRMLVAKGRFIKFNNHTKVYMIINLSSNTMYIYPELQSDISTGQYIPCGRNVTMKCRYDTNMVRGITFSDGLLSDPGSITLVEAV